MFELGRSLLLVLLIIVGLPVALVLAWMFETRRRRENEASEHLAQPEERHVLQEGKELGQRGSAQ